MNRSERQRPNNGSVLPPKRRRHTSGAASMKNTIDDDAEIDIAGPMMILSPAKTLDLSPLDAAALASLPLSPTHPSCDSGRTAAVVEAVVKAGKSKGWKKVLGVSDSLASVAAQYWKDFSADVALAPASSTKPALFAFDGPAYRAVSASSCSSDALAYLQINLRIIDPVHGALRPLDAIQPYRLEMATRDLNMDGATGKGGLAKYWAPAVTRALAEVLKKRPEEQRVVLNLASDEYSAAVDPDSLPVGTRFVKAVFQQEGKVIAVHAKAARGMMVRYVGEQKVMDVEQVKSFDLEGYGFVEDRSTEDCFVFDRKKPKPKPKKKAGAAVKKTK
eukprot:CAMPEP_0113303630 /NCGR_PEP_ID=MMETSP0010_2-20120614/3967_1 /TAXON_ID=216773 ORGANISM="Corethron hystrix, Strain 308" /NCGR_SAMPLE_ID=MMETSP0010_2 /ASSEMBLY_ACC=CAM_ASM_000155 /LENGTH=331 /DNA_ID=CAMNT_0000157661 /DNA_START=216 /DNA_END=1211 /DNA_ORIENTATION=- /assembly_acc=CAM_ASM_000155